MQSVSATGEEKKSGRKRTWSRAAVLVAVACLVAALLSCQLIRATVQVVFTADRTSLTAGECTTLRWDVRGSESVALNGQLVNPSGQMDVCPSEETTYTLSAEAGDATEQREITITVGESPVLSPTVSPAPPTVTPGSSASPTPTRIPTATPTSPPPPPPLTFTFSPTSGPAGSDVELTLSAAVQVEVYYEGRVLPKVVLAGDRSLRVTIPGNASSGYFELRWDGQSLRAAQPFTVTPPPAPPSGLDPLGTPNYGTVSLVGGAFWPDPRTVNMTSGGSVDVYALSLGSGCGGYATRDPDLRIVWSGVSSRLRILFVADQEAKDTRLVINDPNGNWRCNDDSPYGSVNPLVELSNPPSGQYNIWVASFSSGAYIAGTLYMTELDYHPRDLP